VAERAQADADPLLRDGHVAAQLELVGHVLAVAPQALAHRADGRLMGGVGQDLGRGAEIRLRLLEAGCGRANGMLLGGDRLGQLRPFPFEGSGKLGHGAHGSEFVEQPVDVRGDGAHAADALDPCLALSHVGELGRHALPLLLGRGRLPLGRPNLVELQRVGPPLALRVGVVVRRPPKGLPRRLLARRAEDVDLGGEATEHVVQGIDAAAGLEDRLAEVPVALDHALAGLAQALVVEAEHPLEERPVGAPEEGGQRVVLQGLLHLAERQ